jgi:hypothetical protein
MLSGDVSATGHTRNAQLAIGFSTVGSAAAGIRAMIWTPIRVVDETAACLNQIAA